MLAKAGARFTPAEFKYWWRTQLTAYFFRLNDAAIAEIAQLRLDASKLWITTGSGSERASPMRRRAGAKEVGREGAA
jgi:hypothetical protein